MTTGGEELPRRGEVWWVRADKRRPRVRSFLVVPLTSRLQKVLRLDFMERLGTLPAGRPAAIDGGLRLVLDPS